MGHAADMRAELLAELEAEGRLWVQGGLDDDPARRWRLVERVLVANLFDPRGSSSIQAVAGLIALARANQDLLLIEGSHPDPEKHKAIAPLVERFQRMVNDSNTKATG